MSKSATYAVASIKFATPVVGGFPTTWTDFEMKAIVKGSVQYKDSAETNNNIDVEEMDNHYAIVPNEIATRGFVIQTYDMSAEAYEFFYGYEEITAEGPDKGFITEVPGFELSNKAVQITTKSLGDIPAKQFEWANMRLSVVNTGTIGKGGLPNLEITCVKEANLDATGAEVAGARWKPLA
jgi:hypothetical protein